MTDTTGIVADATRRIFRELGDPQLIGKSGDHDSRSPLWTALADAGLTRAWVEEALNGADASLEDGFAILRVAGAFAVAVPLADTLLAAWLLAQARIAVPEGRLTVAPARRSERWVLNPDGTVTGSAMGVAFASEVDHVAFVAGRGDALSIGYIDRKLCDVQAAVSVAGDPSDRIVVTRAKPTAVAASPTSFHGEHLQLMGAAVRAMQMSGALQSILERSVTYANERVAFERPIGRFQVIQHNLARLAGEVAAATAAADSAADAISSASSFDDDVFLEIASAKIRAGEAVNVGAAIAHQVHGAIGYSREHALHRYTQRLWSWRDDFGTESEWALLLGQRVAARGADALWPWLASR